MGSQTDIFFKYACKIIVIIKSDLIGNLRKRISFVPGNGISYAVFIDILHKRHPQVLLEQFAKIAFVISEIVGNLFGCQICSEMLLHIQLYGVNKLDSPFDSITTFQKVNFGKILVEGLKPIAISRVLCYNL